jgi:hypothetical protein
VAKVRQGVLLSICLCACAGDSNPPKKPASAGPQVEQPYESAPANPKTGVAALEGTWNGIADVKGYGMSTAVVTLSSEGYGHYLVTLPEFTRNGRLHVTFWDGRWLHAKSEGYEERIRGTLTGNQLRLELPFVGTVTLQREVK